MEKFMLMTKLDKLLINSFYKATKIFFSKWLPYIIITAMFCFGETIILLFFPVYHQWVWFCFYIVISNFCLSIFPHEPLLLLFGSMFNPLFVAIFGALVTCWVEILNYYFLVFISNTKQIKNVTSKHTYQKMERWFNKAPFLSLLFSSIVSIPISPFRFFAANSRYSLIKFILTVFIGRLSRYYVLALTGAIIKFPSWVYGIFFLLLLSFALWKKIQSKIEMQKKEANR